jgi:SPP1 family predicted phage head-tail adaptor
MANNTIAAGRLSNVVSLQKYVVSSTDTRGQPVGSWTHVCSLRAAIEPVGPRDAQMVNQLMHDATHIVHVRYNQSVTRSTRLKYGDRILNIGHVADLGNDGRVLRLLCSEEL